MFDEPATAGVNDLTRCTQNIDLKYIILVTPGVIAYHYVDGCGEVWPRGWVMLCVNEPGVASPVMLLVNIMVVNTIN